MAKKEIKKEKKHLFGSSEKSDFIVNMTAEGAQKMCGVYSIIAVFLLSLMAIPSYFTRTVIDYTDTDSGARHYLSETFIFYASAVVIGAGILGFIIFAIAHSKKLFYIRDNKSLALPLVVILLSAAACLMSSDVYTSLVGYLNRNDGLLTILGYWGLFSVAMCVTADNRRLKIADFFVGLGAFEGIVGILQAIPLTAKYVPNMFANVFVRHGSLGMTGDEITNDLARDKISRIYIPSRSASGFLSTPFALAAAMSVLFGIAFAGFVFDKSKKRKIFYGISALIMSAASLLTDVLSGVIGIGAAALFVMVISAVKSFRKSSTTKSPFALAGALVVCIGILCEVFLCTGATKFEDEYIMFTDTNLRLEITGSLRSDYTEGDKERAEQNIYTYMWEDGLNITEQNPLLGVGSDNWYEMYMQGATIDRFYNEYIDMAATRGVPCLVFYVLFLLFSFGRMFTAVKNFVKEEESWLTAAFSAGAFAYIVQAFFNSTTQTSAPFFFIALGIIWSYGAIKKKTK